MKNSSALLRSLEISKIDQILLLRTSAYGNFINIETSS